MNTEKSKTQTKQEASRRAWLLRLVSSWIEHGTELNKQNDAFNKIWLTAPDSPYQTAIWEAFGGYTESLAFLLEDSNKWLEWYLWECQLGEKPMSMTFPNGEELLVAGAQDLIDVIICDADGNRIS